MPEYLLSFTVAPDQEQGFLDAFHEGVGEVGDATLVDSYIETGPGLVYNLVSAEVGTSGDARVHASLWRAAASGRGLDGLIERVGALALESELRRVEPEFLSEPTTESAPPVIMRRYQIQGDWDDFLGIWRSVAQIRDKHGFPLLFAVSDREKSVFTWAFSTQHADFAFFMAEGQKDYYADPDRVLLESINAHLFEIDITPARRLGLS